MSTMTGRVALGAAFLDEHDPMWWREDVERAIDLDMLDLAQPAVCVLGQRCPLEVLANYLSTNVSELSALDRGDGYAAYASFLSDLEADAEIGHWARDLGFTFTFDLPDDGTWDELTGEWERVIRERRAAA